MKYLLPEPKKATYNNETTKKFTSLNIVTDIDKQSIFEITALRFWNYSDIEILDKATEQSFEIQFEKNLQEKFKGEIELFYQMGYSLKITYDKAYINYANNEGLINAITSLKMLIDEGYTLPQCEILDYPSISVRAVAPTFSWYAGYGRIGFDSQLWGYDEWVEFLNICADNKINQLNMVMYGYWPFDLEGYDETVFRNVPIKIWNAENRRWIEINYTHPNLAEPFLDRLIEYAHKLEIKIFAYVGLNSYNGAYSIKHPEKRMVKPEGSTFLNDFDSICLSDKQNVEYILKSMKQIAKLGFDGYSLEESEEGFWFCECDDCKATYHATSSSPGEAKHKANFELLNKIYDAVREINQELVIGIRAFRQPPLEKSPEFLKECVESLPDDVVLFWAPGLYVPETEFEKWCNAFGKHRIWARDTEANAITSTMGRLYRTFESNLIRYKDEPNEQTIEKDISQHIGSVKMGVHGINGFMFEWFGLPMHLFAHGNYGWGSVMDNEEFYQKAANLNFGEFGDKVLYVMKNMLTIHESQINIYTTPFPFQKNKIKNSDIEEIEKAKELDLKIMGIIKELKEFATQNKDYKFWLPHFDKWENAQRRNMVIYDLVLCSLQYDQETDSEQKDLLLEKILELNEKDFDIVKEMFFDINPVGQTGVKSCMYPYHEIKRIIHNIRNPKAKDEDIICSGIEALGWLWL